MRRWLLIVVCWGCWTNVASAQQYVLQVPGRPQASQATFAEGELIIRDAVGLEHVYVREPATDTRDRKYLGYYSAASDLHVLWPASNSGPMQIGQAQPDGSLSFRPSQMQVFPAAEQPLGDPLPNRQGPNVVVPGKRAVGGQGLGDPADFRVQSLIPRNANRGAPPAIPAQEHAHHDDLPLDLRGAWYVPGMPADGEVATITRGQNGRLEFRDYNGTQGYGQVPRVGNNVTLHWGNQRFQGVATHDQLSWGQNNWLRVQVLGCYFDATDRPYEIVLNRGRVQIRTGLPGRPPRFEPLSVTSAVDVISPTRGRGRLRNGRLTWESREEWLGPIWLQGCWEFRGQHCDVAQDGRDLTFTNEKGEVSRGAITSQREVIALDWNLPASLNRRQTVIRWNNGDSWTRMLEEDFPLHPQPGGPPIRQPFRNR